jgi:hypothetical protein
MKCFKRLVMPHINTIIPETLDPLQFAYHPADEEISIALHTAPSYPDKKNTYVRMLFIDYSSVINTIVSTKLITKLKSLGLNTSLCNWILDFLTGWHQVAGAGVGAGVVGFNISPVLMLCLFDGSSEGIVRFLINFRVRVSILESGSSSL